MKKLIALLIPVFVFSVAHAKPDLSAYGLKFSGNLQTTTPYVVIKPSESTPFDVVVGLNPAGPNGEGFFILGARADEIETTLSLVGNRSAFSVSKLSSYMLFKTSIGVVLYSNNSVGFESSLYVPFGI